MSGVCVCVCVCVCVYVCVCVCVCVRVCVLALYNARIVGPSFLIPAAVETVYTASPLRGKKAQQKPKTVDTDSERATANPFKINIF